MREIKFEYGFKSIAQKCDVWNVLPIVYVRQFTGCKDKNGIDIYEGDIFKRIDTKDTYTAIWNKDGFMASQLWDEWTKKDVSSQKKNVGIPFMTTFKIEIIGNTYASEA
jgi:uncharacterized phage protein (TIGR01671 family)